MLTGSLAFLTPRTQLSPLCPCAQQFCPRHDPAREAGSSTPPALHRRGDRDPGRGADGSSPRAERRDRHPYRGGLTRTGFYSLRALAVSLPSGRLPAESPSAPHGLGPTTDRL